MSEHLKDQVQSLVESLRNSFEVHFKSDLDADLIARVTDDLIEKKIEAHVKARIEDFTVEKLLVLQTYLASLLPEVDSASKLENTTTSTGDTQPTIKRRRRGKSAKAETTKV